MYLRASISRLHVISTLVAASCTLAAPQTVPSRSLITRNTPAFVTASSTRNLGPEDPSKMIDVSIWLNLHNRAGLDTLAQELYDPNSSRFHSWMKREDFAQFAPSDQEASEVSRYFSSHGMRVLSVGPNNLFVRAQGTVANVSKAFHVALNRYQVKDGVYRSNSSDPLVEGATAALVHTVSGLDSAELKHPIVFAKPAKSISALSRTFDFEAASSIPFFTANCFTGPVSETIGTPGNYPYGVYKGNKYYSSPSDPGCGYTPSQIQTAYNLKALYKAGFDGAGQTVVIIDWCGSPTIRQDANAFSARFGLPPLTTSNFHIINYPGPSTCAGQNEEINLDVEWAHAIAPGANITLLVPPTASFQDIDQAQYYAATSGLGNVISGSYGAPEILVSPAELQNQNLVNEICSIFGVSANFSSGDSGDFTPVGLPRTVSVPAASPYATAIGGVSLALNKDFSIKWQTGWGNNETLLASGGFVFDPPLNFGFTFGSGGGASGFYSKPWYQRNLPGKFRQLPDISWVADPFTGPIIEVTIPGVYPQILEVIGGTSASCPMFSALWAIANQEAGVPLGQAAPYLYSMPKGTITDVLPVGSPTNVTAAVSTSPKHTDTFSATALAEPLVNTKVFYSAIWNYPGIADTPYVLTFGTDSGLTVTPGWDNVTGLGTPNGKAFADYFNPAH